jgi:hypothetical protein
MSASLAVGETIQTEKYNSKNQKWLVPLEHLLGRVSCVIFPILLALGAVLAVPFSLLFSIWDCLEADCNSFNSTWSLLIDGTMWWLNTKAIEMVPLSYESSRKTWLKNTIEELGTSHVRCVNSQYCKVLSYQNFVNGKWIKEGNSEAFRRNALLVIERGEKKQYISHFAATSIRAALSNGSTRNAIDILQTALGEVAEITASGDVVFSKCS